MKVVKLGRSITKIRSRSSSETNGVLVNNGWPRIVHAVIQLFFFFLYNNIFYKNIVPEICEILSPIRSAIILVIKKVGLPLRGRPILLITRMITDQIGLHSVLLPL